MEPAASGAAGGLANLCPDTPDDAHAGLERVGTSYQLCFNFVDHTGLRL
ncbi:hypothetical protein [Saccharothrix deserti]|nr:hypothetical protein [Saccharothrix deserti]